MTASTLNCSSQWLGIFWIFLWITMKFNKVKEIKKKRFCKTKKPIDSLSLSSSRHFLSSNFAAFPYFLSLKTKTNMSFYCYKSKLHFPSTTPPHQTSLASHFKEQQEKRKKKKDKKKSRERTRESLIL